MRLNYKFLLFEKTAIYSKKKRASTSSDTRWAIVNNSSNNWDVVTFTKSFSSSIYVPSNCIACGLKKKLIGAIS